MQSFQPTAQNVKRIGRTLYQEDILWLALSGSGIEFLYEGGGRPCAYRRVHR